MVMAKLFCGFEFACVVNVERRSFSVRVATADNATVAWTAATGFDSISGAVRIVGISRVLKAGSITVTGSENTDSVNHSVA